MNGRVFILFFYFMHLVRNEWIYLFIFYFLLLDLVRNVKVNVMASKCKEY